MPDISKNRYRLSIPDKTRDAFFTAMKKYNWFHKGDFRYLLGLRKMDIQGSKLEVTKVQEILGPKLQNLPAAIFGPPRRLMWPKMDEYTELMNSIRKKVFSSKSAEYSVEECRAIMRICEFYARLQVGQLSYALHNLYGVHGESFLTGRKTIDDFEISWKKTVFGLDANTSLGAGSPKAPIEKDLLWSLMEVIRHKLAWDAHPEGGHTVDFGSPMNWCKSVPLATIERV